MINLGKPLSSAAWQTWNQALYKKHVKSYTSNLMRGPETILTKTHFPANKEVIAVSDRNKILSCPGQNYHIYYRRKVITSAIFQQRFNYTSQKILLNGTESAIFKRGLAQDDFQRLYSDVRPDFSE